MRWHIFTVFREKNTKGLVAMEDLTNISSNLTEKLVLILVINFKKYIYQKISKYSIIDEFSKKIQLLSIYQSILKNSLSIYFL